MESLRDLSLTSGSRVLQLRLQREGIQTPCEPAQRQISAKRSQRPNGHQHLYNRSSGRSCCHFDARAIDFDGQL